MYSRVGLIRVIKIRLKKWLGLGIIQTINSQFYLTQRPFTPGFWINWFLIFWIFLIYHKGASRQNYWNYGYWKIEFCGFNCLPWLNHSEFLRFDRIRSSFSFYVPLDISYQGFWYSLPLFATSLGIFFHTKGYLHENIWIRCFI